MSALYTQIEKAIHKSFININYTRDYNRSMTTKETEANK